MIGDTAHDIACGKAIGARTLASYGVGTAVLELWLARIRPARHLVVTEFAPETADRLLSLLPELEVPFSTTIVPAANAVRMNS